MLPQRSHVTISIYNILGELVTTLIDEEQQAGTHQVDLSGAALATGMYFCRLQAGAFVETKKILVIK
jgi:flagellar hook assembly protein FlgD